MRAGRIVFPALRWDARTRFDHEAAAIERALALNVGGFCIFGGDADAVGALTASLRERSTQPILIASDLERGAGQQFPQATPLPPLAALGSLDDLDVTRQAAALTAREALALGVDWIYAPVADLDLEPRNPIVGSRAFGSQPLHVGAHVSAWIEGCHAAGALCCAKHFPGHGRTAEDSHAKLPSVDASRADLEIDLEPFRAAIAAGADAMMTAHVAYPALDSSGSPATLSRPIVTGLLRERLGFDGLIVTDAMIMEGVLSGSGEAGAAVRAVAAGCDALLYPQDAAAVARAIEAAAGDTLARDRLFEAIARVDAAAERSISRRDGSVGSAEDREWSEAVAARTLVTVRGTLEPMRAFDLLTIDDDLGGPYASPSRAPFEEALRAHGMEPRAVKEARRERDLCVAVYSDIRAWKGRPGVSDGAKARLAEALAAQPEALVVLFGHPRLAAETPGPVVLGAWGGEAVMQRAAARRLAAANAAPAA